MTTDAMDEAREALERFVVENEDLAALESRIGRFNLFDALGIARAEIRHSNFLRFILDPAESHGQGQVFVKALLMDLLKNAPAELRPLSPVVLDGSDLRGLQIRREWRNIDLLILCEEPRFAIVIENKIGSGEHSNQLAKYEEIASTYLGTTKTLFVYLSPDGDEPSQAAWISYTYSQLHRILKRVREANKNSIGADLVVFLDHYLNLLGTRFMEDKELDELCQRIYKCHRKALDLIWDRAGGAQLEVLTEAANTIKADTRWEILYESGSYIDLVPKAWLPWLLPLGIEDSYPFCVHIRAKEHRLLFTLFVGEFKGPQRKSVLASLRSACPKHDFKATNASREDGSWDRVTSPETILEWGEELPPDPVVVEHQMKSSLDSLFSKLGKIANIIKKA